MNRKKAIGKRSVAFDFPPVIIGAGSVAGEKEGDGAFGRYFDMVETDPVRRCGKRQRAECSRWQPRLPFARRG